jgi:hypothetical protein
MNKGSAYRGNSPDHRETGFQVVCLVVCGLLLTAISAWSRTASICGGLRHSSGKLEHAGSFDYCSGIKEPNGRSEWPASISVLRQPSTTRFAKMRSPE